MVLPVGNTSAFRVSNCNTALLAPSGPPSNDPYALLQLWERY